MNQHKLQTPQFRYHVSQKISSNEDMIPQINFFSRCPLEFFQIQLLCNKVERYQLACINFPQLLDETELLPFNLKDNFKHSQFRTPTEQHVSYFRNETFDYDKIVEKSEMSKSRFHITRNAVLYNIITPTDNVIPPMGEWNSHRKPTIRK